MVDNLHFRIIDTNFTKNLLIYYEKSIIICLWASHK